jgi:N-acetylglucosaminyldiphosphoundecaprenol N-acetyl-beta-D-mannosaminyltransferase
MIDRGKRDVLGVRIDVVDYDGAVDRIISAAQQRRALAVTALAVHGVMTGALDPEHRYRLNRMDLVTPDGQPVRWALDLLHGERLPDRVYGPKLTALVCTRAAAVGLNVFLYGSTPQVVADLKEALETSSPTIRIVGAEPSKFRRLTDVEATQVEQRIRDTGADLVLVGLGCPRQEVFVFEHSQSLGLPMVAVGAAFDFLAGRLPKAPVWMQRSGLEWLFRLVHEPRRLWRRYLILNPVYLVLLARQKLGLARAAAERRPTELVRYG